MKIAVYHNQPSGGARRALHELCLRLAARHEIDVFTLTTADEAFLASSDYARRVETVPFRKRPPIRFGVYVNELRELLDLRDLEQVGGDVARRIDNGAYDCLLVDVCRYTQAPSVLAYLQTPAAYYCHEPPRRFIDGACRPEAAPMSAYGRARNLLHRPARAVVDWRTAHLDRRNVRHARRVLTNSEYTRGIIGKYYGRDATVCRLGVDTEHFSPGAGPRERYIVSVGAIEPHKGHDFLVRAIGRMTPELRPRLVIIGNTDDAGLGRRLEALANDLGVQLELSVRASERELVATLRRASAFVYAPHGEPFGLAVLEAMACGLPVVAVAEAGPLETVRDGDTGLLASRDEGSFAKALARVLTDSSLRHRLGARARREVELNWSWDAAAERLEGELFATAGIERRLLAEAVRG